MADLGDTMRTTKIAEPIFHGEAFVYEAGRETRTVSDVLDAVDAVRAGGPSTVLVTSVLTDETP